MGPLKEKLIGPSKNRKTKVYSPQRESNTLTVLEHALTINYTNITSTNSREAQTTSENCRPTAFCRLEPTTLRRVPPKSANEI